MTSPAFFLHLIQFAFAEVETVHAHYGKKTALVAVFLDKAFREYFGQYSPHLKTMNYVSRYPEV